jgi:hypothetical protein
LRLDKDGTPVPLDDERFRTRGKTPCCSTGTIGAASEAQLALFKTSCESLHKK